MYAHRIDGACLPDPLCAFAYRPGYNQGFGGPNRARAGKQCVSFNEDLLVAAINAHTWAAGNWSAAGRPAGARPPRLLFFDTFPYYNAPNPSIQQYFKDDRLSWAKLSSMVSYFRPGIDISLPPPTHNALQFYPHQVLPGAKPAAEPTAKRPLFFFKGNFNTNPTIRNALGKLHDEAHGVLVVNTAVEGSDKYPYAELMATALFSGVPRGAEEFSYRYSEAVCSGSVPVIISDGWVPPLNDLAPVETYGLHVPEAEISGLVERLKAILPEQHARMRAAALQFCHRHIATLYQNVDTMVDLALSYA